MDTLTNDFQTAMRLHQAGQFESAEQIYLQILQHSPNQPHVLHLLAMIDLRRGDPTQAIHYLDRAIESQPNHAGHHFSLGKAQQAQGHSDMAEKSYRQAVALKPDYAEAHQKLGDTLFGLKRFESAVASYRQALQLEPKNPIVQLNLSIALAQQGQRSEAEQYCRSVLAIDAGLGQAHLHLGNLLLEDQRFTEAIASLEQAAELCPEDPAALNNLGSAYHRQGQRAKAAAAYRQALRLAPLDATTHFNLGITLKDQGETESAIASYHKAMELDSTMIEACDNLGNLLKEEDRLDEALLCYQRGLEAQPDHIPTLDNLGQLFTKRKELAQAEQCYRQILDLDPDNVAAHSSLGSVLLGLEKVEESAAACSRAIELDPTCKKAHLNLVETRLVQGALDEAAAHCRTALQIDPHSGIAHYHLASLQSGLMDDEEVANLTKTLQQEDLPTIERLRTHFAMGIICDQREQYDLAFEHYQTANALRDVSYDPRDHELYFSRLIESFSEEFFKQPVVEGNDSQTPIFIVGMPRSGTTLVEQILASHPQVYGAGELRLLQDLIDPIPNQLAETNQGRPIAYSISAPYLSSSVVQGLADEYLSDIRGRAPEALRITDKMPENFHHLGLIALLFPRAKVIHCRRDPLDTCLSCFFQKFAHVPSSFDLEHIGAYYRQYQRLMEHWNRVLPTHIHEVFYEAMVEDLEQVSQALIEHCGLPWDERCLEFHTTTRPINTASVLQVRRPIYRRSVQRWKHYEKHLDPLKRALGWKSESDC